MSQSTIAKYVTPWKFRREQMAKQVAALRERDGDNCRRCRRPLRFDLGPGQDKGPKIERVAPEIEVEIEDLQNLCLCHRRCNSAGADHTVEVTERIRRKSEATLLSRSRSSKL